MTNALMDLKGLGHSYTKTRFLRANDRNTVLEDLQLRLMPGTITALLGRNGSGKSTLMMCALGLIKADQGSLKIFGEDSWNSSAASRQKIGYVPQVFMAVVNRSVQDLLKHWATYYETWDWDFVRQLLVALELNESSKVLGLSVGQQQKLSIVLAMGHKPDLLILDEPISSLDPQSRISFIKFLANDFMTADKAVLYSTHITSDIERITTHVAILKDRHMYLHRELDELKQTFFKMQFSSMAAFEAFRDSVQLSGVSSDFKLHQLAGEAPNVTAVVELKNKNLLDGLTYTALNLEAFYLEVGA